MSPSSHCLGKLYIFNSYIFPHKLIYTASTHLLLQSSDHCLYSMNTNIIFQLLLYQCSFSLVPWNNIPPTHATQLHWHFLPPYHIHRDFSFKTFIQECQNSVGFLMGRWGRAWQRYYIPLFLLTSNFLSSTEIMTSEMAYQVTSSIIYYNKNYKISPMLISIKPLTFLFRCLSDSQHLCHLISLGHKGI